ncbi:hypothetical protein GCM10025881_08080 [Pseudolysinimonas kribbensis]|uniref:SMC hinge domain-containing protein n=1 Tax=Pseudolysinimonas kribbensis TaxID=433641 RepID=A0ABQ6K3G9_9MICO|nr:hypothetical protein GCM10025881_08080 [Pseudolysinimonas kribbensis]
MRDARARLLADEVVELRAAITDVSRSESERKTERLVLQEQLDQSRLRQERLEASMTGDAVDGARRVAFGLEQVQDHLRSLYTLAQQRLSLLAQQAELPGMSATVSPRMIEDAREEAARLQAGVAESETALGTASAATATVRAALDALDEEISAQSALVSQHDLEQGRLKGAVDAAESRAAATRGELDRQRAALEASEARREQARIELMEVEDDGSAVDRDIDLNEAVTAAESAVTALQADVESLRDELHTAERERDALAARTGALSLALDQKDGSASIAGATGIRGLVAEHLTIRPGYEAAIAAALGSLADAVLADSLDAGVAALRQARSSDAGRVEIVIADAPDAAASGSSPRASRPRPTSCRRRAGSAGCWPGSSSRTISTRRARRGRPWHPDRRSSRARATCSPSTCCAAARAPGAARSNSSPNGMPPRPASSRSRPRSSGSDSP